MVVARWAGATVDGVVVEDPKVGGDIVVDVDGAASVGPQAAATRNNAHMTIIRFIERSG